MPLRAGPAQAGDGLRGRLGRVVDVASTFNLERVTSPVGGFKARQSLRVVLAPTESELWLLEFRYWAVGFGVGGILCQFPRVGLVSQWRHRPWAWPAVWKVELPWPELATYSTGSMTGGPDADRMVCLLDNGVCEYPQPDSNRRSPA